MKHSKLHIVVSDKLIIVSCDSYTVKWMRTVAGSGIGNVSKRERIRTRIKCECLLL